MKKIVVMVVSAASVMSAIPGTQAFAQTSASAPTGAASEPAAASDVHAARVDAYTKRLHTELKITPEQEAQWNKVAQTMRDNAATTDALIRKRMDNIGTMTAVDDLKSYGELA